MEYLMVILPHWLPYCPVEAGIFESEFRIAATACGRWHGSLCGRWCVDCWYDRNAVHTYFHEFLWELIYSCMERSSIEVPQKRMSPCSDSAHIWSLQGELQDCERILLISQYHTRCRCCALEAWSSSWAMALSNSHCACIAFDDSSVSGFSFKYESIPI